MKNVGYIGLGIMGSAMAKNLLAAGYTVHVWNRTKAKAEALVKAGAKWCESPAKVAEHVEVVCVNVTDTPDVEEVIFGPHGIAAGNPGDTAGFVIVDHSTISPAATREFSARLEKEGITLLDAPVSGGDVGARAGTLSIMVGGPMEAFERCMPLLGVVGKAIAHCGPSGSGQATKACNQILCAMNLVGVCEAMALAQREGLNLQNMLGATAGGAGGSWALSHLGPQIASGDLSPGFMIDLINKDLKIVRRTAEDHQLPLPGVNLAAELLRAAARLGHGRHGTQALSRVFEQLGDFNYK